MPGVPLGMEFAAPLTVADSLTQSRPWLLRELLVAAALVVLRCGVSDLMTTLSHFCLEARPAGGVVRLLAGASEVEGRALLDASSVDSPECTEFDRKGFPEKLPLLRAHCGLTKDVELEDLEARVLTINKARNCLEHRGGVAGKKGLCLRWVMSRFSAETEDGSLRHAKAMELVPGSIEINLRSAQERRFEAGEPLVFTADDFVGLCWTVAKYGEKFLQLLGERAGREVAATFRITGPWSEET